MRQDARQTLEVAPAEIGEGVRVDSRRVVRWTRVAATLLVAVPAVGIGAVTLWQVGVEGGGPLLNQLFHLGLVLALLLLFCEFAVSISRSRAASGALLLGVGGCALAVTAAIAVELLGPPALLALVVLTAVRAIIIASSCAKVVGRCRTSASS